MKGWGLACTGIVIFLSYIYNAKNTVLHVSTILTVQGIVWIMKKIIASLDVEKAQMLNFAGWCVSGVSMVTLLQNAIYKLSYIDNKIQSDIAQIADFFDKITFWN